MNIVYLWHIYFEISPMTSNFTFRDTLGTSQYKDVVLPV